MSHDTSSVMMSQTILRDHLDQRPVLRGGALEGLGLLGAGDAVHSDVPILTRGQNVFSSPETSKIDVRNMKK